MRGIIYRRFQLIHISSHPYGMLVSHGNNSVRHSKGNINIVQMHSYIVNGNQLLWDAPTVPELHRRITAIFIIIFISHYHTFLSFSFYVYHSDSPYLFLGASIVCVNNLTRTADLILWFPDRRCPIHTFITKMTL